MLVNFIELQTIALENLKASLIQIKSAADEGNTDFALELCQKFEGYLAACCDLELIPSKTVRYYRSCAHSLLEEQGISDS